MANLVTENSLFPLSKTVHLSIIGRVTSYESPFLQLRQNVDESKLLGEVIDTIQHLALGDIRQGILNPR
jgi:hypothetical protein